MKPIRRARHDHWHYEPATARCCCRCRTEYHASKWLPICLKCVGCDQPNPGPAAFVRARAELDRTP